MSRSLTSKPQPGVSALFSCSGLRSGACAAVLGLLFTLPVTSPAALLPASADLASVQAAAASQPQQNPSPATHSSTSTAAQASADSSSSELFSIENKIEAKDLDRARPLLEEYLRQHPEDARARFDLGFLEEAAGQDGPAAGSYRKAIAQSPNQFESRLALGLLLSRQGKLEEAREELEQATALSSFAPTPEAAAEAFRGLARVDRTANPAAARQALLAALKISAETSEDLLLTAQIAEASDDPDTAEEAYRRLLSQSGEPPKNGTVDEQGMAAQGMKDEAGGEGTVKDQFAEEAASGLAQILLDRNQYVDAEAVLGGALARAPEDPTLNAQWAAVLIGEGKKDESLAPLEKLHQREPGNDAVNQMLADAYVQAGHPERADPIYSSMAQSRPGDPAVLDAQAKNLILEEQYGRAQQILERAVKLNAADAEAWSELALAASRQSEYSTALQALSMRAKYLPETAASYFLWATAYDKLHDYQEARQAYHHFLSVAAGKFPAQEQQARERLGALSRNK